ncbi:MAG: HAMP domain-containing sensor histidine kinase [Elusimicrobiota bacterium]
MSIRTKFIIFVSIIIVLVVAGVSGFLYFAESKVLKEEAKQNQIATVKGLAQICREALLVNDDLLLFNYLNLLKRTNRAVGYGVVLNNENQIIAHTDATKTRSYDNSKIGIAAKNANDVFSQEWLRDGVEIFELSIPVMMGETRAGTARLGLSKKVLNEILNETLSKTRLRIASIGFAALVIGVILCIIFATTMTGPIKKLVEGAKLIGEGKLDTVIEIKRKDELGWLAEEFNIMAEKLKELDNMKNDFVNSVSHELRSPLSAIKGYVDFLLKEVAGPVNDKQKEFLTIVKNNTTRLTNFINNVLDVAKMEANKMELSKEPTKIQEVAGEVVTLFKPVADEKKVMLEFTADEPVPEISADGEKIMQVITNLISNAMKFTPEGGRIIVKTESVKREEERVSTLHPSPFTLPVILVSVSDTGIGMTKDDCTKLFNKFVQVSSSKKNIKGPKGTGLGLSIAKGIVELHGGKIWVESEQNKGTTFFFTLPV